MSKQLDARSAASGAYLDHAASSALRPEAIAAMTDAFGLVGNAASVHAHGRAARRALEESRESVADRLGALPSEVVFTAGGTESDNLGLKGLYWARRAQRPSRDVVMTSAVEHHAVLDVVDWLVKSQGAQAVTLPVDRSGAVRPDALAAALAQWGERVALVSVMWGNNEVGTINPVAELAELANAADVPLHVDACQAVGQIPVGLAESGAAALSVAAHKFGGPVGAGALVLSRRHDAVALLHGGGHERGLRSGTSDLVAIRGMAAALDAATEDLAGSAARLARLRGRLAEGVLRLAPDALLNGAPLGAGRLPGNAHFSFPGCEGDSLLMLLDAAGVACSTGSACTAGVASASHVLLAMGVQQEVARASLRFSFGWNSAEEEVDLALRALPDAIARARAARPDSVPV
ncbi:Cysteine desulfurase [Segniliparus rotundus DSM 44985]|uniref:Cysteine desulfurase n=1 Tax=Segniliparus rotundus (strain ATCC BAA-972 / CDC 1076 / CIP 108378 / DSM 44985 / JCM 13578) TaxID=640132 RepID=D6Z7V3_SEGRD|nr:cysteine desulfurase family protein [Segniliparus rotundus]ADG98033.1 Cysteine desulfurase [Segniliparus rotundus DSM 44985]